MSRISLGYNTSGDAVADLFSDEMPQTRRFLSHLAESTETKIQAWFTSHHSDPSLAIRIDGELRHLETAADRLIERRGLPRFVFTPRKPYRVLKGIRTVMFGDNDYNPTTPDALDFIKRRYAEQKVKVARLAGGTLGVSPYYI